MGFAAQEVTIHPTIQLAFQYSCVVPVPEEEDGGGDEHEASGRHGNGSGAAKGGANGNGSAALANGGRAAGQPRAAGGRVHRMALQRRLRVVTLRVSEGGWGWVGRCSFVECE
jgi:hypothetical protein